ncbi:MAG: hypothetical protein HUU37_07705 [Bdellovibrionales bacterium]|nr:hypothetical protein [Bdellovibrionales bacterium]
MDVRLWLVRVSILTLSVGFISCGNRFDLDTERGRRARIDEANFFLSNGECSRAHEAIDPLYGSAQHRTEEVVLIKASAYACAGGYKMLTIAGNLAGASNVYKAFAKSMPNALGDGKISALYQALDVLTNSNTVLDAVNRGKDRNDYMIFLQLGVIGAILHAYGSPSADGTQGANLAYANPRVGTDMSNVDACSLTVAMGVIVDSYPHSNLSDADSAAAKNALSAACVAAGLGSCNVISRDRTSCDGTGGDPESVAASAVVTAVNNAW